MKIKSIFFRWSKQHACYRLEYGKSRTSSNFFVRWQSALGYHRSVNEQTYGPILCVNSDRYCEVVPFTIIHADAGGSAFVRPPEKNQIIGVRYFKLSESIGSQHGQQGLKRSSASSGHFRAIINDDWMEVNTPAHGPNPKGNAENIVWKHQL
jgi:hypothetical protein